MTDAIGVEAEVTYKASKPQRKAAVKTALFLIVFFYKYSLYSGDISDNHFMGYYIL